MSKLFESNNGIENYADTMMPYQLKVLRGYIIATVLILVGFGVFHLIKGDALIMGWVDISIAAVLGLSLWWNRSYSSLSILQYITLICMGFISLMLFLQGGVVGVGYVWVLGFPFMAFFIVGSRLGLWYVSGLFFILSAVALVLRLENIETYWHTDVMLYLAVVYIFFSIMGYFSVRVRERHQSLIRVAQGELKREGQALFESEQRHRALLEHSPNAIAVHHDEKWVYANPSALKMFGVACVEDMIGTGVLDYVHNEHKMMAKERLKMKQETNVAVPMVEQKMLRKNGKVFVAEVQASPLVFEGKLSFLVSFKDISERKESEVEREKLQQQLEHAQRLESLGVLAGGIAHDFNNLLAAIEGNAELARMELKGMPSAMEHLRQIDSSCEHAAQLCQQMLAYAGEGKYQQEVIDLNLVIRSLSKLMRASVPSNIALKMKLDSTLPCVEGDIAQMQQVLLNFIVNASDAMGEDIGEIKVTTRYTHVQREMLDKFYNGVQVPEGKYVVVEVKDTGPGMDEKLISKIFDPFFTTKKTGSGLGLSAVLGIIRGHNGALQVKSKLGEGASFCILLPPSKQGAPERLVKTSDVVDWHSDGRILIVDDESNVRSITGAFAEKLGFEILTATDGQEGVDVFQKHHQKIDVVLMDMTMPRLGGMDAMQKMRKINSGIPIVLVSGYSEMEGCSTVSGEGKADGFLQKPFKFKDLKKSLYKVLNAPDSADNRL